MTPKQWRNKSFISQTCWPACYNTFRKRYSRDLESLFAESCNRVQKYLAGHPVSFRPQTSVWMRILVAIMIRYLLKRRDFEWLCFLYGGKCNHLDKALERKINSYCEFECRGVFILKREQYRLFSFVGSMRRACTPDRGIMNIKFPSVYRPSGEFLIGKGFLTKRET